MVLLEIGGRVFGSTNAFFPLSQKISSMEAYFLAILWVSWKERNDEYLTLKKKVGNHSLMQLWSLLIAGPKSSTISSW